jgi:ABC-type transport system involved in cytochrome bd biosynthesis fused ATPase/permease subunit
MKIKDARLKLMNDVLSGVKVLKLYAWEESMQRQIFELRQKEMKTLRKIFFLDVAITVSFQLAPLIVYNSFGSFIQIIHFRQLWSVFLATQFFKAIQCVRMLHLFHCFSLPCSAFPSIKFLNCSQMQSRSLISCITVYYTNLTKKILKISERF